MKSHAAAAAGSPLSLTMYSEAPPTVAEAISPGPGIGPTPSSALVMPGIRPPSSTLITVPIAADVAIAIAAGCAGSASLSRASWPFGLSPTVTASPSDTSDWTWVSSSTPVAPSNSTLVAGASRPLPLSA